MLQGRVGDVPAYSNKQEPAKIHSLIRCLVLFSHRIQCYKEKARRKSCRTAKRLKLSSGRRDAWFVFAGSKVAFHK